MADKDVTTYTAEEQIAAIEKATDGIKAELTLERRKRSDFEESFTTQKAEFDKYKSDAEAATAAVATNDLESKGKYDEALQKYKDESQKVIDSHKAEIDSLKAKVTTFQVDNQIMAAAVDTHDPQDVVTLITAAYDIREGENGMIEVYKDGAPVLNKDTGKGVDLKELTERFLAEKPQLVKATSSGGAGSSSSQAAGDKGLEGELSQAIKDGDNIKVIKIKAKMARLSP